MFRLSASFFTWAGGIALLVGLLAASAEPVVATQPQDVTIEAHTERGCPNEESYVFTATGAITDSGTVTLDFVRATALRSPTVGTAQYVRTFHGSAGSFTILLNSMITRWTIQRWPMNKVTG